MASMISLRPWPALVMRTPLDQSIQRLPQWSWTVKFSPFFQTMGGSPLMDCGSYLRISSRIGSDSGTGSWVLIVRYFVLTGETVFGVIGKEGMGERVGGKVSSVRGQVLWVGGMLLANSRGVNEDLDLQMDHRVCTVSPC